MRSQQRKARLKASALILALTSVSGTAWADSLVFGFQNPAFSGVGYSAHVLTIENQERSRKQAREDELEAELLAAEREAELR